MTIYEKNIGGLIPQPDRTVATFDSGLIRVDQDFVCTSSTADENRLLLSVGNQFPGSDSPAIDGLVIFPSPQESRTGDGLTRFKVSGYGRATDRLISQRRGVASTTIPSSHVEDADGVPISTNTEPFAIITSNSLAGKITISSDDGLLFDQLNLDPSFGDPVSVLPVNYNDQIHEISRTTSANNSVNWDGQTYLETVTTVKIGKTFPNGQKRVAFYIYSTPKISIDFSTSYGSFTELGISVNIAIGHSTATV